MMNNQYDAELLLERIRPRLKNVFAEGIKSIQEEKGTKYYLYAQVIEKRTLEDAIHEYSRKIKYASKYLLELKRAENQLEKGELSSPVEINPYVKLFKRIEGLAIQFELESPETLGFSEALERVRIEIETCRTILSTSFIENIGKATFDSFLDDKSILVSKSRIGLVFQISSENKNAMDEILDEAVDTINKKAAEYVAKLGSTKIYKTALSQFRRLPRSHLIYIPKFEEGR